MVQAARSHDFTDIIVVQEHRGEPDGMIVCHLPFGPTAYFGMSNAVLRHDIQGETLGTVSQAHPHIIMESFSSKLGVRCASILKHLFPPAKSGKGKAGRTVSFINLKDTICFRHHEYQEDGEEQGVELKEAGPRFDLKLYQIKLGTLEQTWAENEWVLRPTMNSAKKQKL